MATLTRADWEQRAQQLTIEGRAFINGEYTAAASGETFECRSPVDGRSLAQVASCDLADANRAVENARATFESGVWSRLAPAKRKATLIRFANLLRQHVEELALLETLDMGKPIGDSSTIDIPGAANAIHWNAEAIDKVYDEVAPTPHDQLGLVTREPVGVVAAIVPWNFPLLMASWKLGPALATGNSVVLKPSEKSPLTAIRVAQLAIEAGIPAGVLNVLPGYGHTVGKALALHMDVDTLVFTGSTKIAKQLMIYAGESNMKRVWLEAGGKSPNIVFADADLEDRVTGSVLECFNNSGQSCDAPTRMLVERSVYDQVVEIAKRVGREARVGDPTKEGSHIGPLVSHVQFGRVQALIEAGIAEGARLLVGGAGKPEGFETGYFVKPTIFADVNNDMRIAREEVFGPVLAIIPFDTEEEAIAVANDTNYGLAAYVQTGDPKRAERVAARLRAGMVHINGGPHRYGSPFGGYKQSGNGREGGIFGLEDFLEVKTVHVPDAA